jgi:hypothetical protein
LSQQNTTQGGKIAVRKGAVQGKEIAVGKGAFKAISLL